MELDLGLLPQFVLGGLTAGSIYAFIALGFTVLHRVALIINFAQGEFLTVGAFTAVTLSGPLGLPMLAAIPLAIAAVGLVGALQYFLSYRPLRNSPLLILIMSTLAIAITIQGAALFLWGRDPIALSPLTPGVSFSALGASIASQAVWAMGMLALTTFALWALFTRTRFGKSVMACAQSRDGARVVGIDVGRMVLFSFVLAAALGALAGILIAPITFISYSGGTFIGLKGFVAAIVGGMESNAGAVVGGLTVGLLEGLSTGYISSTFKDPIVFGLLLLILAARPQGIVAGTGRMLR